MAAFLSRFSANQTFCGCTCTHRTLTSHTAAFRNCITGNFVVYQDRLEKIYCSYSGTHKILNDLIKFRMIDFL